MNTSNMETNIINDETPLHSLPQSTINVNPPEVPTTKSILEAGRTLGIPDNTSYVDSNVNIS